MKKLGLLVAAAAMVGVGASANAAGKLKPAKPVHKPAVYNPLLKCTSMEFRVKGGGIQGIIGVFQIKGEGEVSRRTGKEYVGRYHCTDLDSNKPVDVLASVVMGSGPGLAPRVALGYFELEGKSDVSFVGHAADLQRSYISKGAKIAWGLGLNLQTLVIEDDEIRLAVRLRPLVGVGFEVGFNSVTVTPIGFANPKQLTDID
jgi:hypothetical protein